MMKFSGGFWQVAIIRGMRRPVTVKTHISLLRHCFSIPIPRVSICSDLVHFHSRFSRVSIRCISPELCMSEGSESDLRPVLGPAFNNKTASLGPLRKPVSKPKSKVEKNDDFSKGKKSPSFGGAAPPSSFVSPPPLKSNSSLTASCSSDASSDSSQSRASTRRISRRGATPNGRRKATLGSKAGKEVESVVDNSAEVRKRCAWVTANADLCYIAFHDEEWGVPVRDDKKLFELLCLSTALAELTWPAILNKRNLFREVFHDFDPIAVSRLNDKKISAPGSAASSLLSEVKLRGIIENSRQVCKIIDEIGSLSKYIWDFVNNKPTVSNFRYPRQVPIKSSKAETISKDLVRRGFRGVGPTVIYSFMQVAGLTNDHLISCFRFQDCITSEDRKEKADMHSGETDNKHLEDANGFGLTRVIDELSLSTE